MPIHSDGCDVSTTPGTPYPEFKYITSVTQGQRTIVGFGQTHDFTDGEIVSFRVSPPFGMVELNNVQSRVIAHDTTSITIDIDSSNFTPFVNAGLYEQYLAVCVPSASGIIPGTATINLEDAFDMKPPT